MLKLLPGHSRITGVLNTTQVLLPHPLGSVLTLAPAVSSIGIREGLDGPGDRTDATVGLVRMRRQRDVDAIFGRLIPVPELHFQPRLLGGFVEGHTVAL